MVLHLVHESVDCLSLLVVDLPVLSGFEQVPLHVLLVGEHLEVITEVSASLGSLRLVLLNSICHLFVAVWCDNSVVRPDVVFVGLVVQLWASLTAWLGSLLSACVFVAVPS